MYFMVAEMSAVVGEEQTAHKQALVTDQPIHGNIGTPLPPLVKPQMTFKYVRSWRYGLCLRKIIIDSSALFFSTRYGICSGGKVLHFRGHFLVSGIFNTAPHPLNKGRLRGNCVRICE